MTEGFRRYTNLAALLHILHNRCITLPSPETWDDRNDAFSCRSTSDKKKLESVLAICFAASRRKKDDQGYRRVQRTKSLPVHPDR